MIKREKRDDITLEIDAKQKSSWEEGKKHKTNKEQGKMTFGKNENWWNTNKCGT